MSYLHYLCVFGSSLPPVVVGGYHVLLCSVPLYLQLFVWRVYVLFTLFVFVRSSLPPVVCMRTHVLFTLFVFVRFLFTSSCLYEDSCLIYIICVCSVPLYLQLFTLEDSCLIYIIVCSFLFTSSCLQYEDSCLIYIICVCSVPLYLQLFVRGLMSYLNYLCLFGSSLPPVVYSMRTHVLFTLFVYLQFDSSLPPVVCMRTHVLFTLFVCVRFLFTSSCLQYEDSCLIYIICVCSFLFTSSCLQYDDSCLIYIICVCSVPLYLQLFVRGLMSYLHYLCLFGSSLPPVVCTRTHVLLPLFVFFGSSLPPVVYSMRTHVLLTLFVNVCA